MKPSLTLKIAAILGYVALCTLLVLTQADALPEAPLRPSWPQRG